MRSDAGRTRGIVSLEQHDRIHLAKTRCRLAQRPRRQQPPVAELARGIDDGNLERSLQPIVLQAVVGDDDVRFGLPREQRERRGDAVACNAHRAAGASEEQRLVSDTTRVVVGADDDRRTLLALASRIRG
jgi:hypothetical protein